MRGPLHFLAAAAVALIAFWAYQVHYDAQAALDRAAAMRAEIAREREAITVLRAEWAWLNRPERLSALVAAHAETLGLEPMAGARYRPFRDAPKPPRDAEADAALIADAERSLRP